MVWFKTQNLRKDLQHLVLVMSRNHSLLLENGRVEELEKRDSAIGLWLRVENITFEIIKLNSDFYIA